MVTRFFRLLSIHLVLSFLFGACTPGSPPALPSPTARPSVTPQPATATPNPTPTTPISTASPASPTPTLTPSPQPPAEHRIGVRVVDGMGEFYDRLTGQKFIPRGNNYIRLGHQQTTSGSILYHSTFNSDRYDPAQAETALRQMHADGYNLVRVFLNGCCPQGSLGDPAGGLSLTYLQNLTDFLHKAKANQLLVMFCTDGPPAVGGYIEILDSTWSEDFAGNSASHLRMGGLRAEAQLWRDLIQGLVSLGAPLDAIFAYQLRNELFFEANFPPFSLTAGTVQTANGKSYDMSSAEDKQRMMDEGLVYWIDATRRAILEVDPTALVTVGFFVPQQPVPARLGDPRIIETRPVIWESTLDFIDLHPYPGFELTLAQYVENFGMADMQAKPILMGEFGAVRSSFSTESAAARALHDWQIESCQYGFDGWLLWTWNGHEQVEFFNGLGGNGWINQALAPINRPDPCAAGTFSFFEYNVALNVAAVASRALPDQPPSGAVDGDTNHWWGAGDFAPQWIQIDLGKPTTVRLIRLVVTQSPPGDTVHQIWVGPAVGQLTLAHTFDGVTVDGQVLEFVPETPLENVRIIRISTRQSPSWVGWKEIEVLAP